MKNAAQILPVIILFFALLTGGCNDLKRIDLDDTTGGVTANFSYTVDGCSAPFVVSFNNLTVGASSFQWDFGSAGSSELENPVITFNTAGTYQVNLRATTGAGVGDTTIALVLQSSSRFQIPSYAPSSEVRINTNVLELADGSYVVAGYFITGSLGKKVYLYKAKPDGTKEFDLTSIGNSSGQYFPNVIRKSIDGDIIVAGTYMANSASTIEFFIMRVSASGVVEKEKLFSSVQYIGATSLVVLDDGTFVVMGTKSTIVTGNPEDLVLVHLDAAFNIKKEETYNQAENESVRAAFAEDSKTIVVFGTFLNQPETRLHMIKIEMDNYSLIDDKDLSSLDSDLKDIWSAAKSKTEDDYVISGSAKNGNSYLLKINENGTSKLLAIQFEPGAFLWVSATADGGFVAGGSGASAAYYVVKTKANLEEEYQFGYSSTSLSPECSGVEQSSDGGYISTGRLNLTSGTTPVLFKHDCQLKTN